MASISDRRRGVGTSMQVVEAVAAGAMDDVRVVADDVDIHVQGDVAWAEGHGRSCVQAAGSGRRG